MGIPRACSVCWFFHVLVLVCFLCQILYVGSVVAQTAQLTVDASPQNAQTIPGNMFGIFFEEINHAGAGGLWAELVSNRGFEAGGSNTPSNIDPWSIIGDESNIIVATDRSSCFASNPIALQMEVLCGASGTNACPSGGVGIYNPGYWGMAKMPLEYDEIVRKMFGNEEEGFQFYNSYAKEKGFSVRRSYCEWDNGHNEMTLRKFVCSREGFREEKELKRENRKRKARNVTRVGCRAKLVIARDQNTGQWYVKEFIEGHNHRLAEPDVACLLRSHRRISDDQKAEILEMQISGIRKHQIMDIMLNQYGGYDKVGYTMRDLYNFCHRNKVETVAAGDAQAVISFLTECKSNDPDFFFQYKTDGEGHLKGLLWCDCQCRLDYAAFGDVVVFDSTYKTNRYNLPLVPFVGVNHHGSTVLFACGITAQETIESYVWMLRTFSDAMAQKHPGSVITDGDLAMQRAIKLVWPNSSHRLCTWHIEQNIVHNVKDDGVRDDFRYFLYDSCSIEVIERKWLKFLDKHNVIDQESWLYQMYERREIWCAAYHVDKCYLGLRSNQRSESLNSRLQENLDRKMTMFELVQHFDHCLSRLRSNELHLDFEADHSEPCLQPDASTIEKEAAKSFTPGIFAKVQFSIKATNKCFMIEDQDGYDLHTYIVGRVDKGDRQYFVKCEICVDEGKLKRISCSCLKGVILAYSYFYTTIR